MVSNISQIVNQLFQKETLDEVSENEIRYFIRQYPYAGTGHLLLAKKLQLEGEKRAFEREIAVTSIYFNNPAWLQFVLQDANGSADKDKADAAPVHPAEIEKQIDSEDELETEEFEVEEQEPQPAEQPVVVAPEEVIKTDDDDKRVDDRQQVSHTSSSASETIIGAWKAGQDNNVDEQTQPQVQSGSGPGVIIASTPGTEQQSHFDTSGEEPAHFDVSGDNEVINENNERPDSENIENTDEDKHPEEESSKAEPPTADHEEVAKREDLDPFGFSVQEASSIEREEDAHSDQLFYDDGEINTIHEPAMVQPDPEEITDPGGSNREQIAVPGGAPAEEEASLSGGSSQEERHSLPQQPASQEPETSEPQEQKDSASIEEFITEETNEEIRLNEEELNAPWETDNDEQAEKDVKNSRSVSEETIRQNFENRKHLTAETLRERKEQDDATENKNQPNAVYKEQPAGEPKMEFDPYHTIDYFASQGIKLRLEDLPRDKLGQQLKSFTEWIRSMKRLPQQEGESRMDDSAQHSIRRIAEHSVEEKEVLTEAMAEVWVKQGNYEKARQIYRKLSLQNPSKSTYFAAKIDQLKVL